MTKSFLGIFLSILGACALTVIALHRDEPVNALWILTAAVCVYLLGYRFYAAWIAAKVLSVDASRATPRSATTTDATSFLRTVGSSSVTTSPQSLARDRSWVRRW